MPKKESLKLAAAIAKAESEGAGGYSAKGGSGEYGAYQFMPSTWKAWAGEILGDPNAEMTRKNQNEVAIKKLDSWLDLGLTPYQAALKWNAGTPVERKGVNQYGVAYDSGAYAKKVINNYNSMPDFKISGTNEISDKKKTFDIFINESRTMGKTDTEILDYSKSKNESLSQAIDQLRIKAKELGQSDREILNFLSEQVAGKTPTVPSVPIPEPEIKLKDDEGKFDLISEENIKKMGKFLWSPYKTPIDISQIKKVADPIIKGIAEPALRVGSSIAQFPKLLEATGKAISSGLQGKGFRAELEPMKKADVPYFGEIKPAITGEESPAQMAAKTLGYGMKLGVRYPISAAKQVFGKTFAGSIGRGALSGAKLGSFGGFLEEAGDILIEAGEGEKFEEREIPTRLLKTTIIGTLFGTAIGTITAGLGHIHREKFAPIEQKIDNKIDEFSMKGLKPRKPPKNVEDWTEKYLEQNKKAIKWIIADKENLKFVDNETGREVIGQLPTTLQEASDAVDNIMPDVYTRYNSQAIKAGKEGIKIHIGSIIDELGESLDNKALNYFPEEKKVIQEWIDIMYKSEYIDPIDAENIIKKFNNELYNYYAGRGGNSTKISVDAGIANRLRKLLDDTIKKVDSDDIGYQELKNAYGAFKTFKKGLEDAIFASNKKTQGLYNLADTFSSGSFVQGVISADPSVIAKGITQKVMINVLKSFANPNNMIKKLFSEVSSLMAKIPIK